jgi:hypothetical protein
VATENGVPVDETEFFSARNVITLLDAPTRVTYAQDGGVRVEKGGVGGAGPTPVDAVADWCRRFAAMVILPRGMADEDDADSVDIGGWPPRAGAELPIEDE